MMKKLLFFAITALCLVAAVPAEAQKTERDPEQHQMWLNEMRKTKQEFLAKELALTSAQRKDFFAAYDEMDEQLAKINEETRELERRAINDKNISDTECEAIARALFEQKGKESEVEIKYFEKFKEILTPQQLVKLKNAERTFTQKLLRHRRDKDKK